MAVVPLSSLKVGVTTSISKVGKYPGDLSNQFGYRLQSLGVFPGRKISLMEKNFFGFIIKIEKGNPMAIGNLTADIIMVNKPALEQAVFKQKPISVQYGFLSEIMNLFKFKFIK